MPQPNHGLKGSLQDNEGSQKPSVEVIELEVLKAEVTRMKERIG